MIARRDFHRACLGIAAAHLMGRGSRLEARDSIDIVARIDQALAAAMRFLVDRQSADGTWRSEIYAPFKDGPSLTSLIAATLVSVERTPGADAAYHRAASYLASMVQSDGTIKAGADGLNYPVYTAAGSVIALIGHDWSARAAWLKYLRERQLVEHLGWRDSDEAYGGWSYSQQLPLSPADGKPASPLDMPNLSATIFALEALRPSGTPVDDAAFRRALTFIQRCQNWNDDPERHEPNFDDGGFFFIPDDPVRNKAGEAGADAQGRKRFTSYGSATADGLRCLLACGLPHDHPRVEAARDWLITHFSASEHPGRYPAQREHSRSAVYFYYCASIAHALSLCHPRDNAHDGEPLRWARTLSLALLQQQRRDGCWINPVADVREDDPLVATPLAIRTLTHCRASLAD